MCIYIYIYIYLFDVQTMHAFKSDDLQAIHELKQFLTQQFEMKDIMTYP